MIHKMHNTHLAAACLNACSQSHAHTGYWVLCRAVLIDTSADVKGSAQTNTFKLTTVRRACCKG